MAKEIELTPAVLSELLRYDPKTGLLFWRYRDRKFFTSAYGEREHKRWNARYAETQALKRPDGAYHAGYVMRQMCRAHRIIWAMNYGSWPDGDIDHINGKRNDNRLENLRIATRRENCRNMKMSVKNQSGETGVCKHGRRWRTQIRDGEKQIHLGVFDTVAEAAAARKAAEIALGYHPNHGRKSC